MKGDRRKWLSLNESSGDIHNQALLDRETESHYQVEVIVKEKKNPLKSSSVFFHLYLDDVNDNAPSLRKDYKGATFCFPLSKPESVIFEGVDADSGSMERGLRFTLVEDEEITRNWTLLFINGSHAKLTMKHHGFQPGIVRVQVKIKDTGKPPLESTVYVPVTICTCTSNKCTSDTVEDSGLPSLGLALGILFGVLAVIAIIIASVFISINKKKKKQKKAHATDAVRAGETARLGS